MEKNTLTLTESQLKGVIAESVKRILKEYSGDAADLMGMSDGEDGPTNEPDYAEEDNIPQEEKEFNELAKNFDRFLKQIVEKYYKNIPDWDKEKMDDKSLRRGIAIGMNAALEAFGNAHKYWFEPYKDFVPFVLYP